MTYRWDLLGEWLLALVAGEDAAAEAVKALGQRGQRGQREDGT